MWVKKQQNVAVLHASLLVGFEFALFAGGLHRIGLAHR